MDLGLFAFLQTTLDRRGAGAYAHPAGGSRCPAVNPLGQDPRQHRQGAAHQPGVGLGPDLSQSLLFQIVGLAPLPVRRLHLIDKRSVIRLQRVNKHIVALAHLAHLAQDGVVDRRQASDLVTTPVIAGQMIVEEVRRKVPGELQLGDDAHGPDFIAVVLLAVRQHVVGDLVVQLLKRLGAAGDGGIVGVLAGRLLVFFGEPAPPGSILHRDLQGEAGPVGFQDLRINPNIHFAQPVGDDAHHPPVARTLQGVHQLIRHEAGLGGADSRIHALFLDADGVGAGVENAHAHIQQQVFRRRLGLQGRFFIAGGLHRGGVATGAHQAGQNQ